MRVEEREAEKSRYWEILCLLATLDFSEVPPSQETERVKGTVLELGTWRRGNQVKPG